MSTETSHDNAAHRPHAAGPQLPASVDFYQKLGFGVENRNDHWRSAMLTLDECRLRVDESIKQPPDAPPLSTSVRTINRLPS